ncbi:DNA-binding protein [uncultured Enterococcus sp.]|uniref:DNA-binding protein n=1 Tax=uncultured Enterococcus sp. TaxID=167972 RepID=UPI0025914D25|nr:DNA-binding protein [uncultured Enterococcus sp.]
MAELKIESVDFQDEAFAPLVVLITNSVAEAFKLEQKRKELPRFMNKKQACEYMHTSFITLTRKYIPMGLRVILIDGEEKIDQRDCDAFYEKFKK